MSTVVSWGMKFWATFLPQWNFDFVRDFGEKTNPAHTPLARGAPVGEMRGGPRPPQPGKALAPGQEMMGFGQESTDQGARKSKGEEFRPNLENRKDSEHQGQAN